MSTKREFEHYISPDDRVDIAIDVEAGTVRSFTANYRARFGERWVEVARYDTAHGHLHIHRFWREPEDQIEELEPPGNPKRAYGSDLDRAEEDLTANWRTYRRRMKEALE